MTYKDFETLTRALGKNKGLVSLKFEPNWLTIPYPHLYNIAIAFQLALETQKDLKEITFQEGDSGHSQIHHFRKRLVGDTLSEGCKSSKSKK